VMSGNATSRSKKACSRALRAHDLRDHGIPRDTALLICSRQMQSLVDPDHHELVENVPSNVGLRTGLFYAKRDRLYVGVPAHSNEAAQVWTYEAED
jgi:hypothetical protein